MKPKSRCTETVVVVASISQFFGICPRKINHRVCHAGAIAEPSTKGSYTNLFASAKLTGSKCEAAADTSSSAVLAIICGRIRSFKIRRQRTKAGLDFLLIRSTTMFRCLGRVECGESPWQ